MENDVIRALDNRAQKDHRWLVLWHECLMRLKQGFYNREYVDIFMQLHKPPDIYTAAIFSDLHTAVCKGQILWASIEVGEEPSSDSLTEVNNEKLSSLSNTFHASFRGGAGDNDGIFTWDEELVVGVRRDDGVQWERTVQPNRAPLEVGYTQPWITIFHLATYPYLARWPYGSRYIHLLCAGGNGWQSGSEILAKRLGN